MNELTTFDANGGTDLIRAARKKRKKRETKRQCFHSVTHILTPGAGKVSNKLVMQTTVHRLKVCI